MDNYTGVLAKLVKSKLLRSCEDEGTVYWDFPDGLRLVFREGEYVGWYLPREVSDG